MTDSGAPSNKLPTTSQRKRARKLVLQALYQWQMSGEGVAEIEAQFRTDNDFEKVDGEYFSELFRSIPKSLSELDHKIAPLLDRSLDDVDPIELCLLRMGAYDLKNRIDIPYRVVINEAVELGKQFGGTDGHKYINSVLDKLAIQFRAAETSRK